MSALASPPVLTAPPAADPLDLAFGITMLDGGLGAVPGSTGQTVLPRADVFCWCACMVCFLPPDVRPDEDRAAL